MMFMFETILETIRSMPPGIKIFILQYTVFTLGCFPLVFVTYKLRNRYDPMSSWDLFKMIFWSITPLANLVLFMFGYFNYSPNHLGIAIMIIGYCNDIDSKIKEAKEQNLDLVNKLVYGEAVLYWQFPIKELKNVTEHTERRKIFNIIMDHCEFIRYPCERADLNDGLIWIKINLEKNNE